jgi:hypothetical protein
VNPTPKLELPPNPFKRSPIKKREDLAGRNRELKSIQYYLNLTASGQSPHLALIGQRGVGKTSLLNGADAIAKDLKLLPVRLDMNEQKANSSWMFWQDLYQTLALSMAKVGCWGGLQGAIYAEFLRMIYSRQPGNLEKAVLQIPYVFSCHQGTANTFECPDALVVHDFEACTAELQSKGFTGIALLIDEADCLGKNVPLLQMFRNIFQVVEHCSLLLAGTEAVFPALSEVFSPIPRQFHRIDIKPFAHWIATMELVLRPISNELLEKVGPELSVFQELHELCGGAPDEIQLYCHHMYRSVEDGSTSRMALAPQVFREVLREYRANSPANLDAVLNAIERLPDKLLFESNWLSRRNLTLDENIRVSVLRRELENDRPLSAEERAQIVTELTEGYRKLYDLGITEIDNCIRLSGVPLTAGFWKSFVEVERGKRWTWDDDSFADNLHQPITSAIGGAYGVARQINISQGREAIMALQALREGKLPEDFNEGMSELIISAQFARESNSTHVVDVIFQIDSLAGKQTLQCRFFEDHQQKLEREQFQEWIDNHHTLLGGNNISINIVDCTRWELPTSIELHRLGRISEHRIPEVFGPSEHQQAVALFGKGDVEGCMSIFARMLADKDSAVPRNNLAFCQILTGNSATGLENATKALAKEYEPLYELNKGIAEFLQDNVDAAKASLRNALRQVRSENNKFILGATYILVLDNSEKKANCYAEFPVEAAILINLHRMGDIKKEELVGELTKHYPDKAQDWLTTFATA